jgi:hypothetical protein
MVGGHFGGHAGVLDALELFAGEVFENVVCPWDAKDGYGDKPIFVARVRAAPPVVTLER